MSMSLSITRVVLARASIAFATAALAGCAHYSPLPLVQTVPLAPSVVTMPGIVPAIPLSVAQVAALAVDSNPDLRATRARRGIARARRSRVPFCPSCRGLGR